VAELKTHFDQVPVAVAKKIAEEEELKRDTNIDEDELQFPEWQKPLQDAILEFDREKLFERLKKVEGLIIERDRELVQAGDGHVERQALNDARTVIRVLTDRTKY
jgi:hypothetical protein